MPVGEDLGNDAGGAAAAGIECEDVVEDEETVETLASTSFSEISVFFSEFCSKIDFLETRFFLTFDSSAC